MTPEQKKARRRVIVKRNAVRKIRDTWERKRRGRPRKNAESSPLDDGVSLPDTDAMLDELPASLVG